MANLDQMISEQLRALAAQAFQLQFLVERTSKKIHDDQTIIEQLTYEIAPLRGGAPGIPLRYTACPLARLRWPPWKLTALKV